MAALSVHTSGAPADPPSTSVSHAQPARKSEGSQLDTVTIEARRQRELIEHEISNFVSAITIPFPDESLARWQTPICPLVAGLPRDQGEFVLARLSQVARDAGIALASPNCTPSNFLIVMTAEPDVLLQKWWARNPRLFNLERGLGGIKHFIRTAQPVRVWYNANGSCPDGEATFQLQGGIVYPTCSHGEIGSRLRWEVVRVISSVIVVVDARRVSDLNFGQLADYIAMIGLAQIRENARPGAAPSIMRLFSEAGAARPQALSSWDHAFLKSLYSTDSGNITQLGEIKLTMYQDLVF